MMNRSNCSYGLLFLRTMYLTCSELGNICKSCGFAINGTHQLLAYADDVNILGGSIHTLKENAGALVAVTREIGLEVSADKTKYMVMS